MQNNKGNPMRHFMEPLIPNVSDYKTVVKPPRPKENYWVGAPSSISDGQNIWLTYRVRNPQQRGFELHIAKSKDGIFFEDVKVINKKDLNAKSLERASMIKDPWTSKFKLFMSRDPSFSAADAQGLSWQIVKLEDVQDPANFDPSTFEIIFPPLTMGGEKWWIRHPYVCITKDPYVLCVGRKFYMFFSTQGTMGEEPFLATSVDGENWKIEENNPVITKGYWHDYHTRISCVLPLDQGFLVYYEGANRKWYQPPYNIQVGLAVSLDMKEFTDVCTRGPLLFSPSGKKYRTLRYMDYVLLKDKILFYYEAARDDDAFELRVTSLEI